jgi:hypothetical protein
MSEERAEKEGAEGWMGREESEGCGKGERTDP